MIRKQTIVDVVDNSGAKKALCFCVYKVGDYASVGDMIMVSVRKATPNGKVKAGQKYKAIVVRTVAKVCRKGGDSVAFHNNAVVLLQPNNNNNELLGTRVTSIVPREVPQNVRSLAAGVC